MDHLSEESRQHFKQITDGLEAAGIEYVINTRLVRGLDYYSRTVFEWVTNLLGAQGTVCAGGRYDGLVEQLGGRATPAMGFAMGVERLVAVLETLELQPFGGTVDAYLVLMGEAASTQGLLLAERLRDALPVLRLQTNCGGGGFKAQFRKADRSGASVALILGDDEITNGIISIKWLREAREQVTVKQNELAAFMDQHVVGSGQ